MRFFFQLPNSGLSNLKICQSKKYFARFSAESKFGTEFAYRLVSDDKKIELTLT